MENAPRHRTVTTAAGNPGQHAESFLNFVFWHFDTNEFTITMLLQPAESGGHFEYVPDLRSAQADPIPFSYRIY